jgi:hypothetical protein
MRPRPFAVEMNRRRETRSDGEIWRTLIAAARIQARRASGEIFGVMPERGGSERWTLP